jgi:short-subunit dehydrogenase
MSDIAAKTIVITGASGGIGAALARHLAPQGHRLALVARRADALAAVAADCGPHALPLVADCTVRADVERVAAAALAHFGQVDVWVNNVGQGITRPTSKLTDDDLDRMMRVNVHSALYGMQAILPHFRARGTGQIVNVSSMLGRVPSAPMRSAYCGAKHFLNAITDTLRQELAAEHPGIVVTLVSPGVVRTDFGLHAVHGGPDSRTLPFSQGAEEVAAVIGEAIATRARDVYTAAGAQARVVAYFSREGSGANRP